MQVGERAGPSRADALDRPRAIDAEGAEDEPGHESTAVHAVGTHDVDALWGLWVFAAGSAGRIGNDVVQAEGRRKRSIVVGEDAGNPETGSRAVSGRHVAGAINEPGGGDDGLGHMIADVAPGSAHPDFGTGVIGLADGKHQAGAGNVVRSTELERRFFEHAPSW